MSKCALESPRYFENFGAFQLQKKLEVSYFDHWNQNERFDT